MRVQKQCAALLPGSYYIDTAQPLPPQPALQGARRADVCIVGAGLAGLSAALELARLGRQVVVLEAMRVGWGASGRNGGQALAGYASEMGPFEQQLGAAAARAAWDMSLEAIELLRRRVQEYRIDCDWTPGALTVGVTDKKTEDLADWLTQMQRDYGASHLRWMDRDETRARIASERYQGGIEDPLGGHLHPLNYTLGLARAALASGVALHEASEALRIEPGAAGRPARVVTAQGEVSCDFVLIAGNVNVGKVSPRQAARIMPVGTYMIATAPLGAARAQALIRDRAAVCDNEFFLDYYRVTQDHRLLFGGRATYSTVSPRDLAGTMQRDMLRVFPQLAGVEISHAWGGFVDITMNRAPDFGRVAPDVLYLQGFCGHGLALTGLAGQLAAQAIAGQAERFDLFARLRHRAFPGGDLLRTPALVLGMLWYRLRELL